MAQWHRRQNKTRPLIGERRARKRNVAKWIVRLIKRVKPKMPVTNE